MIPIIDSTKVDPDLGSPTMKISLRFLNLEKSKDLSFDVSFLILSEIFIKYLIFDGLTFSFKSLASFRNLELFSKSLSLWEIWDLENNIV